MIGNFLLNKEGMTVMDMFKKLQNSTQVKYRETIYRNLEVLKDAGLVNKFYTDEKGICYKLNQTTIKIDLSKLEVRDNPANAHIRTKSLKKTNNIACIIFKNGERNNVFH